MTLQIWFRQGIAKDRRTVLRMVARRLSALSPLEHNIVVRVVPHEAVTGGDLCGFGMTVFPKSPRGLTQMCIPAGVVDVAERNGFSHDEALRVLGECLCHEYAHYEQWRDRRLLTERGVAVRARNLYQRALRAEIRIR